MADTKSFLPDKKGVCMDGFKKQVPKLLATLAWR